MRIIDIRIFRAKSSDIDLSSMNRSKNGAKIRISMIGTDRYIPIKIGRSLGKWTPGPTLNTKRAFHGCASFDGPNGKVIAVVGGFSGLDGPGREVTNTVEFLDMENRSQGWISGENPKIDRMTTKLDWKN